MMVSESSVAQIRPWIRYWARMADSFIFGILLFLFFAIFIPSVARFFLEKSETFYMLPLFFLTIFVEALFLSLLGTTPSKWLLNTKIRDVNRRKPSYQVALKRSFSVWLKGCGTGIPIVAILTMISAYKKLTKEGTTTWDHANGLSVIHDRIGVLRGSIFVVLMSSMLYLIILGAQ